MFTTSFTRRIRLAGLVGLVLMDADDGTGSGAPSPPPADNGGGSDGDGTNPPESGGAPPAPTFTAEQQEAINAEVARQLGSAVAPKVNAAKAQWAKDLQAMADAENQTAEQKAEAAATQARQEADTAIAKANGTLVKAAASLAAVSAGAKADRVEALLTLADLSDVEVTDGTPDAKAIQSAVASALSKFPEFKAATSGGASGGDLNGGSSDAPKPKTLGDALTQHYATT